MHYLNPGKSLSCLPSVPICNVAGVTTSMLGPPYSAPECATPHGHDQLELVAEAGGGIDETYSYLDDYEGNKARGLDVHGA